MRFAFIQGENLYVKRYIFEYVSVLVTICVSGNTNTYFANEIEDGRYGGSPIYYKKRSFYDDIYNLSVLDKRSPSSISSIFQNMNEPNWR